MKNLLLLTLLSLFIYSCSDSGDPENVTIETIVEDDLFKTENNKNVISPGEFIEYHPNGNIKMKGRYNSDNLRTGLWISYYDNNVKWSESYYVEGKRDGHSLTFYPNGQVRYRGEYKMEAKIGTWTFYTETGEITKEEKY